MTEAMPMMSALRRPLAVVRPGKVPVATVRRQVTVPMQFADGYTTSAW